ncbi:amidase signature domain-containing protein [Mycena epipterygia]|nr:amidase signature domain-containing protein [Mycena epipterygia]
MAAAKRETRDQELKKEAQDNPDPSNLFTRSTAHEIVTNIERGVWTASQVLEAFIAQSLVAHSATNCITEVLFEYGRKRAKELDVEFEKTNRLKGPLHGVPISVKVQDDIEGYDTTIGFISCIDKPAQSNADVRSAHIVLAMNFDFAFQFVQSMLDAGAVPFVKTNVPQTMYSYECNNPIWGRTSNPYNAAYSSGGSSGGEACMLSLDASVIGLGSDIAGSLRIPAAYCGIYSLKPGVGRISDCGAKESFPGFDGIKSVCGPMARCMDDLELACRVSFGAPGAYNNLPPVPFRDVALPTKLRFGYYTSDGVIKASPACIRAVKKTINALEMSGHDCVELDQYLTPQILNTYVALTAADGYKTLLKGIGSDPLDSSLSVLTFGPKIPRLVRTIVAWAIDRFGGDKVMSDIVRLSGPCTVEEYHASCLHRNELKKEFCREFWQKHNLDGIITHVHASPQTLHGGSNMLSMMSASPLTYNFLDSPSGAIPVTHVKATIDELTDEWINGPGHGSSMCESELYFKGKKPLYDPTAMDGMPVGVQIIGRTWEDEKVLAMMRVVDDALGKERGFSPGSWEQRLQNRDRTA